MKEQKPQPFEKHKELDVILYHAAHNWKTDMQWSALLEQINILCLRLEDIPHQASTGVEEAGVRKTLKEVKDEIAKEYGHVNWSAVKNKFRMDSLDVSGLIAFCDEANKRFYAQSSTISTVKGEEFNKPLTECMMGRDAECNHPKCPVTDEDESNGRFCTLPLNDYRQ